MDDKPKPQEYFSGFPEAPASDTFRWVDNLGNEHMTTLRAWTAEGLSSTIRKFINHEWEQGAKSLQDFTRAQLP